MEAILLCFITKQTTLIQLYVLLTVLYDINYLPDTNIMRKISLFT